MTRSELAKRLEDALDMEPGEAQVSVLREITQHLEAEADSVDDRSELAACRLTLSMAMINASPGETAIPDLHATFFRLVNMYAQEPHLFNEDMLSSLWSQFFMIGMVMVMMADRPVAQIHAVLDDMEGRHLPTRDDLHLIYLMRLFLAARTGDAEAANRAFRRLRLYPTPDYMVPAASIAAQVQAFADLGRDEEAIDAAQPLLTGQVPGTDEDERPTDPRTLLPGLLLPYLRTGRLDQAREIHRWTRRTAPAANLEFCALTGNEDRGVRILAEQIDFGEPVSIDNLHLLAAQALLARRMVDLGRADETLTLRADSSGEPRPHTFGELQQKRRTEALEFARRFDDANGNTHQSEHVRRVMDAAPILEHLPLTRVAGARDHLRRTFSRADAVPGPTPPTRAQVLDHAVRAQRLHAEPKHLRDLLDQIRSLPEPNQDTPAMSVRQRTLDQARDHARLLQISAGCATAPKEFMRSLEDASIYFRIASLDGDAAYCDAWRGARMFLDSGSEEGAALLLSARHAAQEACDLYQRIGIEIWTLVANPDGLPSQQRLEALARCREELDGAPQDDPERGAALRGWTHLEEGRLLLARKVRNAPASRGTGSAASGDAAIHAEAAAVAYRNVGVLSAVAEALALHAEIDHAQGDEDGAVTHLAAAIEVAPDAAASGLARVTRATVLLARDRVAEAIRDLVEAVAVFERHEQADDTAMARRLLTDAREALHAQHAMEQEKD